MFSSLDRADIVLQPIKDRQVYVQTDHRTQEEITEDAELSTLFAIVRVVNAKRLGRQKDGREAIVRYEAPEGVPDFLARAVRSAGGSVGEDPPVPKPNSPEMEDIMNEAFAALAQRVAREYEIDLNTAGLIRLEEILAEVAGSREEDELIYWTAVFKLASVGGELILASNGGTWQVVGSGTGTMPLGLTTTFQGNPATVNPLGKSMKFFDLGAEDSLSSLVAVVTMGA